MASNLHIIDFIKSHPTDWETLLQDKPYCLIISRAVWSGLNLIMFKYNQIESSFYEDICRECRGIVFNEDTWEPISVPFFKFGNVNEGTWVEQIDWNNKPYVLTKIDGSLIKIVKIGTELLVSTNGTILASDAPIAEQIGCEYKTFYDLVYAAISSTQKNVESTSTVDCMKWLADKLNPNTTYMFELTSRWNRVVVPAAEPKLWFIGVRDNVTLKESFIKDHPLAKIFDTPELHDFSTFAECVETAKNLPWDSEGYVITSRDFKRNKAKSLGYLACHHLKGNGVMSYARALELVRLNEVDEVLSYFPEFSDAINECKTRYNEAISLVEHAQSTYLEWEHSNGYDVDHHLVEAGGLKRKDAALKIQSEFKKYSGIGFALLDRKISSAREWFEQCPIINLVKALGYKE